MTKVVNKSKFIILKVSWCFERSQPLGSISGLKTNSNPSLSYSAHQSIKTNHSISTALLKYFTIYTHFQRKSAQNVGKDPKFEFCQFFFLISRYNPKS